MIKMRVSPLRLGVKSAFRAETRPFLLRGRDLVVHSFTVFLLLPYDIDMYSYAFWALAGSSLVAAAPAGYCPVQPRPVTSSAVSSSAEASGYAVASSAVTSSAVASDYAVASSAVASGYAVSSSAVASGYAASSYAESSYVVSSSVASSYVASSSDVSSSVAYSSITPSSVISSSVTPTPTPFQACDPADPVNSVLRGLNFPREASPLCLAYLGGDKTVEETMVRFAISTKFKTYH